VYKTEISEGERGVVGTEKVGGVKRCTKHEGERLDKIGSEI